MRLSRASFLAACCFTLLPALGSVRAQTAPVPQAPPQVCSAARPAGTPQAPVPLSCCWSFNGCYNLGSLDPTCRDVYLDASGRKWICLAFGTTTNPDTQCHLMSSVELARLRACALQ
ncbi:MAG TPA: hypothetical protein VF173_22520 [Thermoanaerobaculia bacterium]|nr:hypothetical protein [Thermoanaerobaculia bacterium]